MVVDQHIFWKFLFSTSIVNGEYYHGLLINNFNNLDSTSPNSYVNLQLVSFHLGITSLFEAYSATPDYCNEEGQQDVATQLIHVIYYLSLILTSWLLKLTNLVFFINLLFKLSRMCCTFQANAIINSLTASVSKVQCALAQLNGHPAPDVWLMPYISSTKDKQASSLSLLPFHR